LNTSILNAGGRRHPHGRAAAVRSIVRTTQRERDGLNIDMSEVTFPIEHLWN